MRHITIIAFENTLGSIIHITIDIMYMAHTAWCKSQNSGKYADIHFDIVTPNGSTVSGFSGVPITITEQIDRIKSTDLILISSVWKKIDSMLETSQGIIPWLISQHMKGAMIACMGTGTFLLAETGMLDGKEATTYWSYTDIFKKRYPKVDLKPSKKITSSENIYCFAGMNSGLASAIYLIEKAYGLAVAQHVEKYYLVDSLGDHLSLNISFLGQKFHDDTLIKKVQQWIENNYAKSFLLEEIAMRFGMSLRNLTRRFKLATGESLLSYLRRYRIEIAKELLKTSDFNIQEIAYQVGYEDISYFHHLFKKHTTLTPNAYRKNRQSSC